MPHTKNIEEKKVKTVKKTAPKKAAPIEVEEKIQPVVSVVKNDQNFVSAVGRRKNAVARVRLYQTGTGKIIVNTKDYQIYFPYFELNQKVVAPLEVIGKRKNYDFSIKVQGGGSTGQADACRHGITRVLIKYDPDCKKLLKAVGFITRDPRVKERKKPGLKKARRAPQWRKR